MGRCKGIFGFKTPEECGAVEDKKRHDQIVPMRCPVCGSTDHPDCSWIPHDIGEDDEEDEYNEFLGY